MYRGKTCQEIGATARGHQWLVWFKAQRDKRNHKGNDFCHSYRAVTGYLASTTTTEADKT